MMENSDKLVLTRKETYIKEIAKTTSSLITLSSLIIFILTSIAWIYNSEYNLSIKDNLFYFVSLLFYSYFPLLFIIIFGELKLTMEKVDSEKHGLSDREIFSLKINHYHPIFLLFVNLIISWSDFNKVTYFSISLIFISFNTFLAIRFASKYFQNISLILILILFYIATGISGLSWITTQPLADIAKFRFNFKMTLLTIGFGGSIVYYIYDNLRKKDKRPKSEENIIKNRDSQFKYNLKVGIYLIGIIILFFSLPSILIFSFNTKTPFVAVRTGSMYPEIQKGDLVFVMGVKPSKIKNNSIIVYNPNGFSNDEGFLIVHRVVDFWNTSDDYFFITKGDNNTVNDVDTVEDWRVMGIVYGKLSSLGWTAIAIEDWNLEVLLIISSAATLILSVGYFSLKTFKLYKIRKDSNIKEENPQEKKIKNNT